jgi:hypothetical protein
MPDESLRNEVFDKMIVKFQSTGGVNSTATHARSSGALVPGDAGLHFDAQRELASPVKLLRNYFAYIQTWPFSLPPPHRAR